MKKISATLIFLFFIVFTSGAQATPVDYYVGVPSIYGTVVGDPGMVTPFGPWGYFYSATDGHSVTETYTGTGQDYVTGFEDGFWVHENTLTGDHFISWDVLINSVYVGSWSWTATSGQPDLGYIGLVPLNYTFAPIYGYGTYEIAMIVTNDVPGGCGDPNSRCEYISIGAGEGALHGGTVDNVPEPSTILLLGAGMVFLGALIRRKAAA